ncbi:MAG: daunorubicin resistance transporter ATPase subunit [Acidobacteria bacterium]|nr:daunorubicin resistance transporter ATPase subunit [Acidobacteriota bacterium]
MEMIATQGLCKTFRNKRAIVEAVRDVDLSVREGEIYGFLGPNGAGKTTTMRILTTLMAPTSGRALVVGRDLFREARRIRQDIGYVSQLGGTYEYATAYENLVLQGRLYGLSRTDARAKADRIVLQFDMAEYANRNVMTYSGGQKRHVHLGMGIMHDPKLLFLDEPTTGLDPASRARFWEVIRGLRDRGITIFLTTHYLDEADHLCDTVCIMDHGRVVASGTPSELKRRVAGDVIGIVVDRADAARTAALLSNVPGVYSTEVVGDTVKLYAEAGEKALSVLLPHLVNAGITIARVEMSRPSLDEVFLKTTGRAMADAESADAGGNFGARE